MQGRNASGVITCLTTAADGDVVGVNGKAYTIKDVVVHTSYNAPAFQVPIDITPSGNDAEELADRLAKAIMSGDSTVTATVEADTASPPAMTKVRVKVRQPGTAGNAYTLSETGSAVTVSGATFTGGTAESAAGFVSSVNLTGKKVLVLWYDKHPGVATAPLMVEEEGAQGEGLSKGETLKAMRFRAGRQEDVDVKRREEEESRRREDEDEKNRRSKKPGPR